MAGGCDFAEIEKALANQELTLDQLDEYVKKLDSIEGVNGAVIDEYRKRFVSKAEKMKMSLKLQKNCKKISIKEQLTELVRYVLNKPDELLFFSLINFALMLLFICFVKNISSGRFLLWISLYYVFWFGFFRFYYKRKPYILTNKIFGTLVPSTKIIMLMFLLVSIIVFAPFVPLFLGYNQDYAIFIDKYVAKIQILGNSSVPIGSENMTFVMLFYAIFLLLTPNIIIRPMFAWISSLIGRSGSIRNAFSNSRGNYHQLLMLAAIVELPTMLVEQICINFTINPVIMWIFLSPMIVLANVMIAKLYDSFFLSAD